MLRADDPRCAELERQGYRLEAESWGARLRLDDEPDLTRQQASVARAVAAGIRIGELGAEHSDALWDLERVNGPDYPATPATPPPALDRDGARRLWRDGRRVFGAFWEGQLVGATVVTRQDAYAETEFTSVRRGHRGRGIGTAVKAASILALAADGVRTFGTGGAAVNQSVLAANRAVGYEIEERWCSYRREGSATAGTTASP